MSTPPTDRDLDAMAAWLEGDDDAFVAFGEVTPVEPSRRFFGKVLLAAKYGE